MLYFAITFSFLHFKCGKRVHPRLVYGIVDISMNVDIVPNIAVNVSTFYVTAFSNKPENLLHFGPICFSMESLTYVHFQQRQLRNHSYFLNVDIVPNTVVKISTFYLNAFSNNPQIWLHSSSGHFCMERVRVGHVHVPYPVMNSYPGISHPGNACTHHDTHIQTKWPLTSLDGGSFTLVPITY